MNKLIIISVALSLPLLAWSRGNVSFVDSCSEKEVNVTTPNGVNLNLNISDLDPTESLKVKVIFRPSLPVESLKDNDQVEWDFEYGTRGERGIWRKLNYVNQDGVLQAAINLPKRRWMRQVEERLDGYRIWDAEVTWHQPEARISGSLTTSFYNSPLEGPYYQIISDKKCQWQTEAEVASKPYENSYAQVMYITREAGTLWEEGATRGITLGYNNFQGNVNPLAQFNANAASAFLGWLFSGWENQSGTQRISTIERSYALLTNEAGLFIKRMSFNRHHSKKFIWNWKTGKCGSFTPISEGFLDVGNISEDFVVVPKEYMGRANLLKQFINKASPSIKNCQDEIGFGAGSASDVIQSGRTGMLFYYVK